LKSFPVIPPRAVAGQEDVDFAPGHEEVGMMSLSLRHLRDAVDEVDRAREVLELESLGQFAVAHHPLSKLPKPFGNLLIAELVRRFRHLLHLLWFVR